MQSILYLGSQVIPFWKDLYVSADCSFPGSRTAPLVKSSGTIYIHADIVPESYEYMCFLVWMCKDG